jgi:hypothetical protein
MLGEKTTKKISTLSIGVLVGAGLLLSLPAIFLSIPKELSAPSTATFGEALWNLRGLDVVLQALVILTVATGIIIVLYEKRKGGK